MIEPSAEGVSGSSNSESKPPDAPRAVGSAQQRRAWQLPRGVSSGTWDYVTEPAIATEYDSFHDAHSLMALDVQLVKTQLTELCAKRNCTADQLVVADLGCGTARVARQLEPLGYRTLNIDLSRHMLSSAAEHFVRTDRSALVQSNMVELDWLRDKSLDMSLCLFSSLGMIRGRQHRVAFLRHVQRTLKPDGLFVLHVHNRGHSWFDPEGPRWLISTLMKSWFSRQWQLGDRVYVYRGLPQMYLHIYSHRELVSDLRESGFKNFQLLPIDLRGEHLLPEKTRMQYFRAGGYFALCS